MRFQRKDYALRARLVAPRSSVAVWGSCGRDARGASFSKSTLRRLACTVRRASRAAGPFAARVGRRFFVASHRQSTKLSEESTNRPKTGHHANRCPHLGRRARRAGGRLRDRSGGRQRARHARADEGRDRRGRERSGRRGRSVGRRPLRRRQRGDGRDRRRRRERPGSGDQSSHPRPGLFAVDPRLLRALRVG